MFTVKLHFLLFLLIFGVSNCDRRIQNGIELKSEKRYVVYFLQAQESKTLYKNWICGGALVTDEFILTSAACVDDVRFLYAIAGYNKYVSDEDIEIDDCTRRKKKKVVYTCTPISYELGFDSVSKWSYVDIALAKVESPYNFDDNTYNKVCSYIPTRIPINYIPRYQEAGIDTIVMGWGHEKRWRQPSDLEDYNQPTLRYAPCVLEDKEICKESYAAYDNMTKVIDKYMICSKGVGNFNEYGEVINKKDPAKVNGCSQRKLMGFRDMSCEDNGYYMRDDTRRDVNVSHINNKSTNDNYNESTTSKRNGKYVNGTRIFNISDFESTNKNLKRRNGICQNDHGGPIVTWIGSHEVVIGVASVFKVNEKSECVGPYLYTSTQCNGAFLNCVLTNGDELTNSRRSRALCNAPPIERGYDTVERKISWIDHPTGPADNER